MILLQDKSLSSVDNAPVNFLAILSPVFSINTIISLAPLAAFVCLGLLGLCRFSTHTLNHAENTMISYHNRKSNGDYCIYYQEQHLYDRIRLVSSDSSLTYCSSLTV